MGGWQRALLFLFHKCLMRERYLLAQCSSAELGRGPGGDIASLGDLPGSGLVGSCMLSPGSSCLGCGLSAGLLNGTDCRATWKVPLSPRSTDGISWASVRRGWGVVVTIRRSSHLTGSLLPRICMTSACCHLESFSSLRKAGVSAAVDALGATVSTAPCPLPGEDVGGHPSAEPGLELSRETDLLSWAPGWAHRSGTSGWIEWGESVTLGTWVCLSTSSWWRKCGPEKEQTQTSTPFPMTSRREFSEAKGWPYTPGTLFSDHRAVHYKHMCGPFN
jgi:hypothetical protein